MTKRGRRLRVFNLLCSVNSFLLLPLLANDAVYLLAAVAATATDTAAATPFDANLTQLICSLVAGIGSSRRHVPLQIAIEESQIEPGNQQGAASESRSREPLPVKIR